MTAPTNWPDPNRPGVPMFPEYRGKHTLVEKRTGEEVAAIWGASELLRPEWDVVGLSAVSEDVARYFTYVRCERVYMTPAQIAEMLAAERERCAIICENEKPSEDNACRSIYLNSRWHTASRCAANIRNLGAAP